MSRRPADTCQQVVELVTEYLDGGLDKEERVAFERHVMICPPCRGYLAQIRRVERVAGALPEVEVPERLRASLLDAFRDWKDETRR